jgi:hypothetical protein
MAGGRRAASGRVLARRDFHARLCVRLGPWGKNPSMKRISFLRWNLVLVLFLGAVIGWSGETPFKQYTDSDFGYVFQFPSSWEIQELPEGVQDKDVRVILQSPDGSSFMIVVEKLGRIMTRAEFDAKPDPNGFVGKIIGETIEQVYKRISKDIKATEMRVGDRMNLSSEVGIRFYISTLHSMDKGKPIIVAGIHVIPFGKDHMINFVMTAMWDREANGNIVTLKYIFNSFRLLGEPSRVDRSVRP